ncbi:MAG: SgcJ/EcaC family oxidoreductase [Gemmatimonadota bacterium]
MSQSDSADETAIHRVYAALFAALEAKDGTSALSLITADFESVDPHGIGSRGREEFAETFAILTSESSLTETRHSLRIVALAADEAEVALESEGTIVPRDGKEPQVMKGHSHDWLRRERDGEWRLSRSVGEFVGPPDDTIPCGT